MRKTQHTHIDNISVTTFFGSKRRFPVVVYFLKIPTVTCGCDVRSGKARDKATVDFADIPFFVPKAGSTTADKESGGQRNMLIGHST